MASIILPNQLFSEAIDEDRKYLVEDQRYFKQFNFHKKKLVLHRASMKAYQEKVDAQYLEFDEEIARIFRDEERIVMYDPVDHEVRKRFEKLSEKHDTELEFEESPGFMVSMNFNKNYFSENKYFQLSYYKTIRERFDILMDKQGNPEGGKWSFDPENRNKMPEKIEKPEIPSFSSRYVENARKYVERNFADNPGTTDGFFWPVTREQAQENLEDFLKNRLQKFGDYQDSIESDLKFGFHSLLSSSINTGLITPDEVLEKTLDAHNKFDYPMNSVEGFIRQIVGWREFTRAVYELEPDMREANFWGAKNSMPDSFYTGDTGLPPVDDSVDHALDDAYCHHIERLMVLGNIMLLLEIDPEDVYEWFMEMFIDSYDWVMAPNVYGMGQYSWPDMMTKPYISSSNYIKKMSHYESGDWEDDWTGLYWNFINKHEEKISDIQRMSFMTSHLDRMSDQKLERHLENAEKFRESIGIS